MKGTVLLPLVITVFLTCVQSRVVKRSDDVSLQALQTLVQQQASAVQTLQADVAALKTLRTEFDALKNQVQTSSKAVAFTVHFSHDNVNEGIGLVAGDILHFDSVVTNIGNGYDVLSGMFTAPVTGVYIFFLTEMAPNNHNPLGLNVMKEGQVLDMTWAPGNADIDDQGSSSLVSTHLQAGQRVWIQTRDGDAVRGDYWTIFTGYLLQTE